MTLKKIKSKSDSLRKAVVTWLSEETNTNVARKSEKFYTKFQFNSLVASIGDFVLVLNADEIEPGTVDGSYVAKILQLYETDTNPEDPYRAVVQWYSRVRDLPTAVLRFEDYPALCCEHEVVEDNRPFDNDISIETIYRNCKVVFVPPSKNPKDVALAEMNNPVPLFVCRFQLVSHGRKRVRLEPISAPEPDESSSRKSKQFRQRKLQTSCDFVSDYVTSPGQQKFKACERTQSIESDKQDSDDDQVIKHSLKKEQHGKHLSFSSNNSSSQKRSKGMKVISDVQKTNGLKSSDRKRKINSDLDSDFETTPKQHVSSQKFKRLSLKVISNEKSSSKVCGQDCVTPAGNSSHKSEGNRSVKHSKVRRKLSIDLEDIAEPQCALNGDSSDRNTVCDDITKQSTPTRKGSKPQSIDHTPSMPQRKCSVSTPSTVLEEARSRLHVSAVPQELPCREEEFQSVYHFVRRKVMDNVGGCMYISGVPGTGKTATVHEVLAYLQSEVDADDLPEFKLVKINGMQLTEPRQAYVEILRQLTGQKMKSQQAQQILEKRFKTIAPRRTMTVLVVDELDLLCTRRQDVVYNLLDWPNYRTAHLVVITIANTMDLPERCFINRVNSRMGLTRVTFQPYSYVQLQKIVMSRLDGLNAFDPDAVQLIARKVAAVSGDARRALDMCRRATEISSSSSEMVTMNHVNQVLQEMITSPKIQAIRSCSVLEQAFLRATAAEVARTGVEETVFSSVYQQLYILCLVDNLTKPTISQAFSLCARLSACRLLLTEHSRASTFQRIILNVSADDVHYATSQHA